MATNDPTRTTILRRDFRGAYNAMWARVERRLWAAVEEMPAYLTRTEQIQYFERNLREILTAEAAELEASPARGLPSLLQAAYMQGLNLANFDAKQAGIEYWEERERPQVLVQQDDHKDEIAALLLLLLSDWQGIQQASQAQAMRAFVDSLDAGDAPGAMRAKVRDRLMKIGRTRTGLMVASYVVAAVNAAILARAQDLGVGFVVLEEELEFVTAGDNRVCPRCRNLAVRDNGYGPGIFTLSQARGVIPVHALCRCRWRIARSGRAVLLDDSGRLERL